MGGLLGKSKSSRPEEVWRQESHFENRLAQQKHPDTWGGVTSYNLLDIQDVKHRGNSAPQHKPLDSKYGNHQQNFDFELGAEESDCPKNYRPNPARPPVEKHYYSSPRRVKTKTKNIKNRPDWINDIDTPDRKQSINSVISTVDLQQAPHQPFRTLDPAKSMREPRKPASNSRSSSLPSMAVKSPNKSVVDNDYNYLDKFKPPPQYMTNRERIDLLRQKQEKENNNNLIRDYDRKKVPVSKSFNSINSDKNNSKPYTTTEPRKSSPPPKVSKVRNKEPPKKNDRPDPSKLYSVPNKKVRSVSEPHRLKTESSSKSSSRTNSTSNNFNDINGLKSATLSVASTASNFSTRTKVISFNDKKQSLGSIGVATITKLDNNFKLRQFPDGGKQGFSKAVSFIESDDWEKTIEGLELLVSVAKQHPDVLEADSKTTRNVLLKSIKNLRSQVCRAGCQAVATVFLSIGKSLEADTESLVKELLQKSADTNKFIRSDSFKALEVMAENFSVYRVISLVMAGFSAQKNVVIRANIANIVDSVIVRLGAERFMGSSQELQELVMVDGSKMMVDASSDVRAHGRHLWSELVQHSKTEQMLKQYLREVELRNIKKTLDSLK